MTNREYWEKRAKAKVLASEKTSKWIMNKTLRVYKQAEKDIQNEIKEMFDEAGAALGIDVATYMKKKVNGTERKKLVKELRKLAKAKGVDYTMDKEFNQGLTRLEVLKEKVKIEAASIRKQTNRIQKDGYKKVIDGIYEYTIDDLEQINRYPLGGANIDKKALEQIVSSDAKWNSGTYRSRNGKNTKNFSDKINNIIGSGVATGSSLEKIARRITDQFAVSTSRAMRLVQTESAYFHGQADLKIYKEFGVISYEFMDILDEKTCTHCEEIAGKTFSVDSAIVGENYPPIHPWCRCTTVAVLDENPQPETPKLLEGTIIEKRLTENDVRYKPVKELKEELTENQIIEKIGGKDKTDGACVSQAFAYIGNKIGLNVKDYRGGKSQEFFSNHYNQIIMYHELGINYQENKNVIGSVAVWELLDKTKTNTEYFMTAGEHGTIVRKKKNSEGWEYLELQKKKSMNGFKPLEEYVLDYRFKCGVDRYGLETCTLVDIKEFKKHKDKFREILGYINTQK